MLEAMLNHFRSYGMNDLEFIIVNSKLPHSQEKLHELQKRVSFGVYQETEQEEVWRLMEGGKDDMFVYDRCGRLTFYVPFPVSILNESPLVSNAILATYFRSPCGVTCDQNSTLEMDEFVKNLKNDPENDTTVTVENEDQNFTEQYTTEYESSDIELSNDLLHVISQNEFDISNFTDSTNITDYEYPLYNNNDVHNNETNSTTVDEAKSYFSSLYKLFFNSGNDHNSETNFNSTLIVNETSINETNVQTDNKHNTQNIIIHSQHQHSHKHEPHAHDKPKKKTDRCVEADYAVCKSWSKRRLLHAQKCCSSSTEPHVDDQDERSCHNFGKRRCKKLQLVLKCCIKTLYTETEVTTALSIETTEADVVVDSVCCKTTDTGKFCRVSATGACDEGEYIEDSPRDSNCKNVP